MFWLPLATTIGGALLGAHQGKKRAEREADIQRRTANVRAAEQQYAPWTGRQSFTPIEYAKTGQGDAMLSGALGMGMTGASIGSSADKFFGGLSGGDTNTVANPATSTGYLGANTQIQGNQAFMPKSFWEEEQLKLARPELGSSFNVSSFGTR